MVLGFVNAVLAHTDGVELGTATTTTTTTSSHEHPANWLVWVKVLLFGAQGALLSLTCFLDTTFGKIRHEQQGSEQANAKA